MKLKLNNKLVILSKKKIALLFIIKFIWIIIVHFLRIMLWLHLLYIIIIYLYDQYG